MLFSRNNFIIIVFASLISLPGQAKTFIAQGSDLLMGTSPQAIGIAGAVTANISGVYASYWNPAGLITQTNREATISRQTGSTLEPISFIGISGSYLPDLLPKTKLAYAFAWLPRLHVSADGVFEEYSFETLFLRFALPEIPSDFEGHTQSKTRDFRFSLAVSPAFAPKFAIGFTTAYIRCVSDFCGSNVNDPDSHYSADTEATAIALNIGLQYQLNDQLKFGANIKDINTTLKVKTVIEQDNIKRNETFYSEFPHDLSFGAFWKALPNLELSSDYQFLLGDYGEYNIDIQLWRTGIDYKYEHFHFRLGTLIPTKLQTGSSKNIRQDMPAPFLPTAGIGWRNNYFAIDTSIYPHPIMSYQRQALKLVAESSISVFF